MAASVDVEKGGAMSDVGATWFDVNMSEHKRLRRQISSKRQLYVCLSFTLAVVGGIAGIATLLTTGNTALAAVFILWILAIFGALACTVLTVLLIMPSAETASVVRVGVVASGIIVTDDAHEARTEIPRDAIQDVKIARGVAQVRVKKGAQGVHVERRHELRGPMLLKSGTLKYCVQDEGNLKRALQQHGMMP